MLHDYCFYYPYLPINVYVGNDEKECNKQVISKFKELRGYIQGISLQYPYTYIPTPVNNQERLRKKQKINKLNVPLKSDEWKKK